MPTNLRAIGTEFTRIEGPDRGSTDMRRRRVTYRVVGHDECARGHAGNGQTFGHAALERVECVSVEPLDEIIVFRPDANGFIHFDKPEYEHAE